jgi:hypothetical protein
MSFVFPCCYFCSTFYIH